MSPQVSASPNPQNRDSPSVLSHQSSEVYLKLQIDPSTQAVIPMTQAQEVVVIPRERITPIPNMPPEVMGLLNQRSRVFWVIDLPRLLNLSPLEPDLNAYNLAIVRANDIPLGLVVQQIQGVIRVSETLIQSPIGNVSPHLAPYLRGCILQPHNGIVLVLDALALINY